MDLPQDFVDLLAEFARADVRFLVIGGYAVGAHGRPRAKPALSLRARRPKFSNLRSKRVALLAKDIHIVGVIQALLYELAFELRLTWCSLSKTLALRRLSGLERHHCVLICFPASETWILKQPGSDDLTSWQTRLQSTWWDLKI